MLTYIEFTKKLKNVSVIPKDIILSNLFSAVHVKYDVLI